MPTWHCCRSAPASRAHASWSFFVVGRCATGRKLAPNVHVISGLSFTVHGARITAGDVRDITRRATCPWGACLCHVYRPPLKGLGAPPSSQELFCDEPPASDQGFSWRDGAASCQVLFCPVLIVAADAPALVLAPVPVVAT